MAKTHIVLTNYETGEERDLHMGQGAVMAAKYKLPNQGSFILSLVAAYILVEPSALNMTAPQLVAAASKYFEEWEYEERADAEEGQDDFLGA